MKKITLNQKQNEQSHRQIPFSRDIRIYYMFLLLFVLVELNVFQMPSPLWAEEWEPDEEDYVLVCEPDENNPFFYGNDSTLFEEDSVFNANLYMPSSIIYRGQTASPYLGATNPYNSPVFVAQASNTETAAPTLPGAGTTVPTTTNTASAGIASEAPTLNSTPPSSTISNPFNNLSPSVNKITRLCNKASFEYSFIPRGNKHDGLQVQEFDLATRFIIPSTCLASASLKNSEASFYIAPKFSFQLWNGDFSWNGYYQDFREQWPKSTFNAGADFGFNGEYGDFGVDAFIDLGIASSFNKIGSKAFYIRGRAMGTLAITGDSKFKATLGAIYYDRNHIKLLPSGGVIWQPNPQNVWRLVFPDPYIGHHLGKLNDTDWWAYINGDIGGGRWLIRSYGESINVDYNDYRFGLGLSFTTRCAVKGNIEVGGAFGREMYSCGHAWFKPNSSVYLKGGISY